jgi:INO80 complex subunit C
VNIESPPSMYPSKKYCDLTGARAPYTDPKTKLRFADAPAYDALRRLSPEAVQLYLGLRRAAVVLK